MEKIDKTSLDIEEMNIEKIKELFPNCVTEGKINFDILRELLGDEVDESKEKYQLMWNGKSKSIKIAQAPSTNTLIPLKDKSKSWNETDNIYIEGDNLEALKLLQKTYFKKIKCIYIDPPYNTGNNLIYKNDYSISSEEYLKQSGQADEQGNKMVSNPTYSGKFHSDWLSMMYERLIISRNLLTDDGVLICAIDENEFNTLGLMLDELFNTESYCITIVHNPRGIQGTNFSYTHEYAYFVFKTVGKRIGNRKIAENEIDYRNLRDNGGDSLRTDARNCFYPIIVENGVVVGFGDVVTDENMHPNQNEIHDNKTYIYPIDKSNIERKWRYARQSVDSIKDMLIVKEINGKLEILLGKNFGTYRTVWSDSRYDANEYGKKLLNELVPNNPFDFPKSLYTVYDCIYAVVENDKDAIVLDYFSGSATTAHALMELNAQDNGNRKFIMVQYPEIGNDYYETICDVGETRIKNAGEKIKSDWEAKNKGEGLFANDVEFSGDIGFKVFKIDSTNIKQWDNTSVLNEDQISLYNEVFKEGRTKEDILYEIMLKYGIFDMKATEITIKNKKMFKVGSRYMIVCLEDQITSEDIKAICEEKPRVVVFKEEGFANDNDKINAVYNLEKAGVEDVRCI